jgi:hypothetical protein
LIAGQLGPKMNTFTADPSLQQSLASLPGLTEVRDAQGVLIGYFSPASRANPEAYAEAAAHFDPNELKERRSSREIGRTTSEVLSRIASLEK